jgi:hypothetical protein
MPYQKTLEPKVKEIMIPSGGAPWSGINRYEEFSRYTIQDNQFDDLINAIPMGPSIKQIPGNSAPFVTLPSPAIWMIEFQLNAGFFIFALCEDGHLRQVAIPGGAIVDCSTSTSLGPNCDIALWQETNVIISDPDVSKTYSWDGTTFTHITALDGVKGAFITVFSGRLWLSHGNVVVFTQGGTFNSLGGDSGSFLIIDSDCITPIQALFPFNGLLYIFGQDWVQVLGNLFVSGSPAVLQFTKYTIEVQVGLSSKWSLITFGSTLYWANPNGIWSFTGTVPQKISMPVDNFFDQQESDSTLASCFCEIYSEPCLAWAVHTSNDNAYGLLAYSVINNLWFRVVLGQTNFVTDGTINNVATCWGTDGLNIFTMFTDLTDPVTSTWGFKYWNFGTPIGYKRVLKMGVATMISATATATMNLFNDSGMALAAPFGSQTQSVTSLLIFIGKDGNPINWTN